MQMWAESLLLYRQRRFDTNLYYDVDKGSYLNKECMLEPLYNNEMMAELN